MKKIASFQVDHDRLTPGLYISRQDGSVVTYDLRTRTPNAGDYMTNLAMHSVEHLFATLVRDSEIGKNVLYFGPMGCQTGFYLLVDREEPETVLRVIRQVLEDILAWEGALPGQSRKECGNWENLALEPAKEEARRYLAVLKEKEVTFCYA